MANPIFYFAWVDQGEAFNAVTHARNDERIVSFNVTHDEGDFAALEIRIKNPLTPLLAAGHKIWAYLSWDNGSGVQALFFGRLVGVPTDLNKEVVTLSLIARPPDFNDRKLALANTLKIAPYWDPIFIDVSQHDDADLAWEARSEIWHINRVTHEVTSTNLLTGEDGLSEFQESDVPYDSVEITLGDAPLRAVTVSADISWIQADRGTLRFYENSQFTTFGADQLAANWPKTGASLDGGWDVEFGEAHHDLDRYPDDAFETSGTVEAPPAPVDASQTVIDPLPIPSAGKQGMPIPEGWLLIITDISAGMSKDGVESHQKGVIIPVGNMWGTLRLAYDAKRDRKETVTFTLSADVQPILTMPEDQDVLTLSISGADVGTITDEYGATAIGDVRRRTFFPTDRGRRAIEYLIMVARAHLAMRARAVDVTWECRFERAVELSGRMNAFLHDRRMPGGTVLGKIKSYGFKVENGEIRGSVKVGCAIGRGGNITAVVGDGVYAAPGYMRIGYQRMEGHVVVIDADASVGYTVPANRPNDDGLHFPLQQVPLLFGPDVKLVIPEGGRITEVDEYAWKYPWLFTHSGVGAAVAGASKMLEAAETHIRFTIQPVDAGPFQTDYNVVVTNLKLPTMIDLEA